MIVFSTQWLPKVVIDQCDNPAAAVYKEFCEFLWQVYCGLKAPDSWSPMKRTEPNLIFLNNSKSTQANRAHSWQ